MAQSTRQDGRDLHGSGAMPVAGRVPPQDLEAEKAVLSALLLDNNAIHSVLNEVLPEDFYHPSHQQIYRAMLSLQDENEPVDLHTLSDYLQTKKTLDAVGGVVFLSELADYESTAANVQSHAKIVRDKALKRNLIRVATEVVEFDPRERRGRGAATGRGRIQGLRVVAREGAQHLHGRSTRWPPRGNGPRGSCSWSRAAS